MERKKTRLNESEMKVMQIIWNAGHPITGQQVLGQITVQYKGSWQKKQKSKIILKKLPQRLFPKLKTMLSHKTLKMIG